MTDLICSRCKDTKPVEEFYRTSKYKLRAGKLTNRRAPTRDYRASECRGCMGERGRAWRARSGQRLQQLHEKYARRDNASGRGAFDASIHRATKRGAFVSITLEQWQAIYFAKVCHWCEGALHRSFTHVDHIVPLSEGGEHTQSNLVAACANCNMRRAWERKTKYHPDTERQ